jgi:hypothetical protein
MASGCVIGFAIRAWDAMQILASGAKGWNLPMKIEADRVYSEIVATA